MMGGVGILSEVLDKNCNSGRFGVRQVSVSHQLRFVFIRFQVPRGLCADYQQRLKSKIRERRVLSVLSLQYRTFNKAANKHKSMDLQNIGPRLFMLPTTKI